jgi:hypothetical protein
MTTLNATVEEDPVPIPTAGVGGVAIEHALRAKVNRRRMS